MSFFRVNVTEVILCEKCEKNVKKKCEKNVKKISNKMWRMPSCEIRWKNIKLIINIDIFNNKFIISFIIIKYDIQ